MTQVYLACMNSGFRYMTRWVETSASYYPSMMQMLGTSATDPEQREKMLGAAVDNLRAHMREMGELPLHESQRLQAELEGIARKFWPAAEGEDGGAHWRRWKAKD
jgi:hypothetical protein